MTHQIDKSDYRHRLASAVLYHEAGKVTKSLGLIYEAHLPGASVGSMCRVNVSPGGNSEYGFDAEVIGFKEKRVILMPFEEVEGVNYDSQVVLKQKNSSFLVGRSLLGRVIDGRGEPIDGKGPIEFEAGHSKEKSLYQVPTSPLSKEMIREPLDLGVRAVNGMLTCGKGQRFGIMAGSGVGKSVLLGMMARNTKAGINVIALIGERGREVREFIERDLGEEGLARSVVIVATSETSPLVRRRGAFLAVAIAEYFRDEGEDVLLLMDSLTRFCMAQRQIGLAMGEPPASKGYTPSVFALLPQLLERAGTGKNGQGSITGIYTVLVEGDDLDEPVSDSSRAILDGHIVLTRELAERNHYPSIDVLQSTSRVMPMIISEEHRGWYQQIREWMALYRQVEDLINLGAYAQGANPKIDQAVAVNEKINEFLKQGTHEKSSYDETLAAMHGIVRAGEAYIAASQAEAAVEE